MAKKSLSDLAEDAMRSALNNVPELKKASEPAYCTAVAEAADAIKVGAEMRLEELEGE